VKKGERHRGGLEGDDLDHVDHREAAVQQLALDHDGRHRLERREHAGDRDGPEIPDPSRTQSIQVRQRGSGQHHDQQQGSDDQLLGGEDRAEVCVGHGGLLLQERRTQTEIAQVGHQDEHEKRDRVNTESTRVQQPRQRDVGRQAGDLDAAVSKQEVEDSSAGALPDQ